jgi:hypothetical protein
MVRKRTVTETVYGMDGHGPTVKAARADAVDKLKSATEGSYTPRLLASRGWQVLLWRDLGGWHMNTLADADGLRRDPFQCGSSGGAFEKEYVSALLHLAQMTWDGAEWRPPCLDDVSALARLPGGDNLGRRLLGEWRSWRGFQLAYKACPEGLPECKRHQWACEHAGQFADVGRPAAAFKAGDRVTSRVAPGAIFTVVRLGTDYDGEWLFYLQSPDGHDNPVGVRAAALEAVPEPGFVPTAPAPCLFPVG